VKPKISFIVLNWHHESETLECLSSIFALTGSFVTELIIVDNESSAQSREILGSIKDVKIVANIQNKGFAGGVNSGLAAAGGDYVALVNNDCVLDKNWASMGLKLMKQYSAGVIGGIEYSWNENNPAYSTKNLFHSLPLVNTEAGFTKTSREWFSTQYASNITGSNMLFRAELLKQLNGFDEDFFTYYEDSDLCARLLAHGDSIVYSPDLKIWHKRNLSTNDAPFKKYYYAYRNQLIYIAKNFPDNVWFTLVIKAAVQNVLFGIYGKERSLRASTKSKMHNEKFTKERRKAFMGAGMWGLTHIIYLRRKRSQNKKAQTYDSNYVEKIRWLQQ
jgi:GT2 family glycosyltransferase